MYQFQAAAAAGVERRKGLGRSSHRSRKIRCLHLRKVSDGESRKKMKVQLNNSVLRITSREMCLRFGCTITSTLLVRNPNFVPFSLSFSNFENINQLWISVSIGQLWDIVERNNLICIVKFYLFNGDLAS